MKRILSVLAITALAAYLFPHFVKAGDVALGFFMVYVPGLLAYAIYKAYELYRERI